MIVLGLDPSLTQFGWALHDTEAKPEGRCLARGRFQTSSKTLFVDRYVDLRESVRALVRTHQPDKVGVESPVFKELYSEGMYGLFLYVCEALRKERKDVVLFSPMQVKAHAREFHDRPAGWKMMKPDMCDAAKKHTGGKGRWNHNEADAYWVAVTAGRFWKLLAGEIDQADLTQPELDQFTRIHTFTKGKKAGRTIRSGLVHREDDRFFLWAATKEL